MFDIYDKMLPNSLQWLFPYPSTRIVGGGESNLNRTFKLTVLIVMKILGGREQQVEHFAKDAIIRFRV